MSLLRFSLVAALALFTACSSNKPKEAPIISPAKLATPPIAAGKIEKAVFSRDGARLFLLISNRPEHVGGQLYEADLKRGKLRRITWHDGTIESFDVGAGDRLVYASTTDEIKERPHPSERPATQGLPTELYLSDRFGDEIERLTEHPGYDGNVAFVNDGEDVVYVSRQKDRDVIQRLRLRSSAITPEKTALPANMRRAPRSGTVVWENGPAGSSAYFISAAGDCRTTLAQGPEKILGADVAVDPNRLALVIEDGPGTRLSLKELPEDAFSCAPEKKSGKIGP